MTRKRYSAEFKREAVAMARSPGVTLKQVGEDLGISAHLLGRWRKLLDEDGGRDSMANMQLLTTRHFHDN